MYVTMKSKGGKREWLCPSCKSANIDKSSKRAFSMTSNVGSCIDCNSFFQWNKRIKIKATSCLHKGTRCLRSRLMLLLDWMNNEL